MNVFLDSVGCRLNQSEIERIGRQIRRAGHTLVSRPEHSDLVVLNTCTVTSAAAADSRAKTRRAHRENKDAQILLTGCWSTLEPKAARNLPGVVDIVPNHRKDELVQELLDLPQAFFDREPIARKPLPGIRGRTRAFIKVQDGCDNHCTFCLTTVARGPARSLSPRRVLREVRAAQAGGALEVVLTGVQLSAYGQDLHPELDLADLVRAILHASDVPRVRLSSLEPWGLPEDFFQLWSNPRLCRHLHLPLQAGCDRTLRRMGRPISTASFAQLVQTARQAIPGLAVSTDVIVGFPGERESEFETSRRFVQEMAFSDAHVFTYSPRPETAAVRLSDRVHPSIAKERSASMRATVAQSARAFESRWIGKDVQVLWESVSGVESEGWHGRGRTDNNLRVHARSGRRLWNRITPVRIRAFDQDGLEGVFLKSELD
jgi:threonylcarbamoyladenosine tRNA methylthiotransferase MtaB